MKACCLHVAQAGLECCLLMRHGNRPEPPRLPKVFLLSLYLIYCDTGLVRSDNSSPWRRVGEFGSSANCSRWTLSFRLSKNNLRFIEASAWIPKETGWRRSSMQPGPPVLAPVWDALRGGAEPWVWCLRAHSHTPQSQGHLEDPEPRLWKASAMWDSWS